MNIGAILMTVFGLALLLALLLLPLFTRSRPTQPPAPLDPAREDAYRRGLMIGSLMETIDAKTTDPQKRLEQAMIEELFIDNFKRPDQQ